MKKCHIECNNYTQKSSYIIQKAMDRSMSREVKFHTSLFAFSSSRVNTMCRVPFKKDYLFMVVMSAQLTY